MWQHLAGVAFPLSGAESSSTIQNCLVTPGEMPWFDIERVFLLFKFVSFLGCMPSFGSIKLLYYPELSFHLGEMPVI